MFTRADRKVVPINRVRNLASPSYAEVGEFVTDFRQREAWARAVKSDDRLSPSTRLTALALADHLNLKNLQLNPSIARLAHCVGTKCHRAVIEQVKTLVSMGWIEKHGTRGRTSNRYQLRNQLTLEPGAGSGDFTMQERSGFNPAQPASDGNATLSEHGSNAELQLSVPLTGMHPNKENILNNTPERAFYKRPSNDEKALILASLERTIGDDAFATWFKSATFQWSTAVTIVLKRQSFAEHVRVKYRGALDKCFGSGQWVVLPLPSGCNAPPARAYELDFVTDNSV